MNSVTFVARILFISLFLVPGLAMAQQGVRYEQLGFEEAMAKAKKEKKIIFTDVQRDTPSDFDKRVAEEVFPIDSISDFFRKNCIAIRINMHTEEGKKFAPRLAMLMYPAYVFYTADGDQLEYTNAALVAKDPSLLMKKARASMSTAHEKMVNKRSIAFTKGSWNELLARAKKENKLIFLDAHTEWCRPCIMMAKNVFTLDKVADFYNKNFINAEMDMEKGEGPALAKKYAIRAYPSFLFINGDGKLVSRDGGYQEADQFIKAGQTALDAKAKTNGESAFVVPMALMQPSPGGKDVQKGGMTLAAPKEKPSAIQFSGKSWEGMLAEARETGKLIFMDAYTTWCGPCKVMRANVFTLQNVGDLFNRNFVNAYIDMEKGEGIGLRKKYDVRYYPTYLFINGNGDVVHRVVGSCSAEAFMQHGLDALSPANNLLALRKAYPAGTQDPDLIQRYLRALGVAYDKDEANKVASDYLQSIRPDTWLERENYNLIREYIKDATSPVFTYLVKNRDRFGVLYGEEEVDGLIHSNYLAWPIQYVSHAEKDVPVLDKEGYGMYVKLLQTGNYDKKEEVLNRAQITIGLATRDWPAYTSAVNRMLEAKQIPASFGGADQLYMYAVNVSRFCENDKTAWEQAIQWTNHILEEYTSIAPGRKAEVMNLQAGLLEKTGQKKKAAAVRKQIDKEKLADAQKGNPMQMLIVK